MRNEVTVSHKFALLLSPHSIYFRTSVENIRGDSWTGNGFKDCFGIKKPDAMAYALGITQVNDNTIKGLVETLNALRCSIKDGDSKAQLLDYEAIVESDLDSSSEVGEAAVLTFAKKKLGYSSLESIYEAIDLERNIKPKPNCDVYLDEKKSIDCFSGARGVYAVLAPSSIAGDHRTVVLALRVERLLKDATGHCIRAKLNIPNAHFPNEHRLRFQYRGHLIPTLDNCCWTVQVAQVLPTVDHEEYWRSLSDKMVPKPDYQPDRASIRFFEPNANRTMGGLISSLSQRPDMGDPAHYRRPYSAKVIAMRLTPEGYGELQTWFMKHGTGFFESPVEVLNLLDQELEDMHSVTSAEKSFRANLKECVDMFEKLRQNGLGLVQISPDLNNILNAEKESGLVT